MANGNISARCWRVTRHFNDAASAASMLEEAKDQWISDKVDYVCFQLEECPTTQRLHWQMFIHCPKTIRRNALRLLLPALGQYVPQTTDGTPLQNVTYCTKDETRVDGPWIYGELPTMGKKQTTAAVVAYFAEYPNSSVEDIASEFPVFAFHNYGKIEEMVCRAKRYKVDFSDFVLRDWQSAVLAQVEPEADDRHVIWVTDLVGKKGKSKLAKFLVQTKGAVILSGKVADMAFVYKNNQAPIVCFDIARAECNTVDHIYSFAEKLKNGELNSGKYQSVSMQIKPPHVIIFSNKTWDRARFSIDRVIEFDLQTWVAPVQVEDEDELPLDSQVLQGLFDDLLENPLPPDNLW